MKILFVASRLPFPLDSGAKIRAYHLLKALAEEHRVTLLTFCGAPEEAFSFQQIEALGVTVWPVLNPKIDRPVGPLGVLANLASRLPVTVQKYAHRAMVRQIGRAMLQGFDVVHCEHLHMAPYLKRYPRARLVLDAHNVEAQIAERYAQLEPHRLKRRVLRWNWRKMLSFEMRTVAEMDLVLAVSDTDRGTFSSHRVGDRVQVLENGVDLDYFAPRDGEKAGQGVFVGSMDWLPNTEGIRHCIAEVLPLIRRVRPDFELSVVGRNPPSELAALAACDPGLEVTGTVDDVRPYIARAEVYLVPLGFGGGTRLKILEAFAMGKAVVSTTLGCEGIACRHGEHLLIADSPEDFAAAVLRLLAHPELRLQLAANAMGLVQEKYSWDSIGSRLLACYEGLQ